MTRAHDIAHAPTSAGWRWYDVRPQPRRRSDLIGFSSTPRVGLGWVILALSFVFTFPWWW